ncbi:MAG: Lin1244/Lin1753 domain-containing protein [Candidatus Paceibacterota bacterium]
MLSAVYTVLWGEHRRNGFFYGGNLQYFKHYSNMRHDIKIKRLINRYGLKGYGLYNLILESITEKITTESPIPDLQETCDDIAEFYNGNSTEINDMANYMIQQGLFTLDDITGRILCNKLYKFLEQNQTRSKQIRILIKAWKDKQPLLLTDVSDSQETAGDKSEEQNRTEQNRTEQNNKESESFLNFWNIYNKKTAKEKCIKLWNKINPDLYTIIFDHAIKYVKATPDKQFRKNPDTYLRNKCWNDEIISKKKEPEEPKRPKNKYINGELVRVYE